MGCFQSKGNISLGPSQDGRNKGPLTIIERLKESWELADENKDGFLTLQELKAILYKLNLRIPRYELHKQFEAFDKNGDNRLEFEEFEKMFKKIQSLPNLQPLFQKFCEKNQDRISATKLHEALFLNQINPAITISDCKRLIMEYAPQRGGLQAGEQTNIETEPLLPYESFLQIMTNPELNEAIDAQKYTKVYQDMTLPLSQYYISSSHNTYLTGNQLRSVSSPKAIASALSLGVRVVELDTWDGIDLSLGPIVNHGHTLCKPTSSRKCLEAIKEFGFISSMYPVIVSIENHCSPKFQAVLAEDIETILGPLLYKWTGVKQGDETDFTVGPEEWLSPEQLKGKVIIRDKPKFRQKGKDIKKNIDKSEAPELDEEQTDLHVEDEEHDIEESDEEEIKTSKIDEHLLQLMYIKNVKLQATMQPGKQAVQIKEPEFRTSSSIPEGKMNKLTKPGFPARDLAQYSQRHIIRIFPAGIRTGSSNYTPTAPWNAGCQVVALNYQTKSLPVWINQGKFSDNGGCGYILKPDFLRENKSEKLGKWNANPTKVVSTLSVRIMSGHYLPKVKGKLKKSEIIDPYVSVYLQGIHSDEKKETTKVVYNNGFNPSWDETFTFKLRQPELALLCFVVKDHDLVGRNDFIAQRVVPLSMIVPGHRMLSLLNENGEPTDSYLFCEFVITKV